MRYKRIFIKDILFYQKIFLLFYNTFKGTQQVFSQRIKKKNICFQIHLDVFVELHISFRELTTDGVNDLQY